MEQNPAAGLALGSIKWAGSISGILFLEGNKTLLSFLSESFSCFSKFLIFWGKKLSLKKKY